MTKARDPQTDLDDAAARRAEHGSRRYRYTSEEITLALRCLRGRHYEVFHLHNVERLSYAEIGQHLGISPDRVEQLMAQALFRLIRATRLIRERRSPSTGGLSLGVRLRLWLGLAP